MAKRIFPDRNLTRVEIDARFRAKHKNKPEFRERKYWSEMKGKYGLTKEQFNAMYVEQEGRCPICNVSMQLRGRESNCVCVDHNHDTNEVRGLLCRNCNTGLGYYANADIVRKAAEYLERYG